MAWNVESAYCTSAPLTLTTSRAQPKLGQKNYFWNFKKIKKNQSRNILNVSPIICSQMISNGGLVIILFLFHHVKILFRTGMNRFPSAAPIPAPAPGPAKWERAAFAADSGGCRLPSSSAHVSHSKGHPCPWPLHPSSHVPLHFSLHPLPKAAILNNSVPAPPRIPPSISGRPALLFHNPLPYPSFYRQGN